MIQNIQHRCEWAIEDRLYPGGICWAFSSWSAGLCISIGVSSGWGGGLPGLPCWLHSYNNHRGQVTCHTDATQNKADCLCETPKIYHPQKTFPQMHAHCFSLFVFPCIISLTSVVKKEKPANKSLQRLQTFSGTWLFKDDTKCSWLLTSL